MNSQTNTYQGWVQIRRDGDNDDALFISSLGCPLADALRAINNKQVSVRYWICDAEASKDEASEAFMRTLMGDAEVDYFSAYSEITGYLWTDEDLFIGGHDLMAELRSAVGKWLILEVEVNGDAENPNE